MYGFNRIIRRSSIGDGNRPSVPAVTVRVDAVEGVRTRREADSLREVTVITVPLRAGDGAVDVPRDLAAPGAGGQGEGEVGAR